MTRSNSAAGTVDPNRPLVVRMGEDNGRDALLVDGVVQSISAADGLARGGYWAAMVPKIRPRRVLILGLGGATLAHLIAARWGPEVEIVGVDNDRAVVETARTAGWLNLPSLRVVEAEATAYVCCCTERFQFAALDLYHGENLVGASLTRPFLSQLRRLLEPSGWLAANLYLDIRLPKRVERIGRVFHVVEKQIVQQNVIVHAHA